MEELVKIFNPTLKRRKTQILTNMNWLRYWVRYVCKGEVNGGGNPLNRLFVWGFSFFRNSSSHH